MTREMAIEVLTRLEINNFRSRSGKTYLTEALIMAINALQTEQLKESPENFNKDSETESMLNADLISRQSVLEEIEKVCFSKDWRDFRINNGSNGQRDYLIKFIEQMPSVQPEQKVGHWIPTYHTFDGLYFVHQYVCSECKAISHFRRDSERKIVNGDICPNCKAKMEEGE